MSEKMTTSDPTTGEIVRALRYCADVNSICGDACPAHIDEAGCRTVLMQNAADRLESQEQTIKEQKYRLELLSLGIPVQMTELTARAERAERERDAVVDLYVPQRCSTCAHNTGTACAVQGKGCKWKYRGLPQDGEGV